MADPELGNLAEHELLATVALLRQLAAADGVVSAGEVRELSSFAEAIGPERWDACNRKLEQDRPDDDGIRELARPPRETSPTAPRNTDAHKRARAHTTVRQMR